MEREENFETQGATWTWGGPRHFMYTFRTSQTNLIIHVPDAANLGDGIFKLARSIPRFNILGKKLTVEKPRFGMNGWVRAE